MNATRMARMTSILRWPSLLIVLVLLLSLVGTQPVMARPQDLITISLYVSATTGSDVSNNCATLATPCQTINYAIGQAAGTGEGIAVASGTYGSTSGTEVVLIDKNVSLLGGYDTGFTAQTGTSVIDGGGVRRGITVQAGVTTNIERFTIQNGFNSTLGGGIYNAGTLVLSDSTLSGNSAGPASAVTDGGGAIGNTGTLSIYGSTLNGNSAVDSYGAAIHTSGTATLYNTTVTGNLLHEAILVNGGTLDLHNSTVAYNPGFGIWVNSGTANMMNSILALNTSNGGYDCHGAITSDGYNLLGSNDGCTFTAATGDQVGTAASPINPRLMPLADNGGPTQTRALYDASPARNAGSPLAPGTDPTACEAVDQRGTPRGADQCDIGAFEGSVPTVLSITRASVNPTSAPNVYYTVTFSSAVHGIDTVAPLSDFKVITTGTITGAKVKEITGSGSVYTVRIYTGTGNGTVALKLVDLDTIKNASEAPLGGPGLGNGNFTAAAYTITRIPKTISPGGLIWDNTPTFKWTRVPQATQYSIQLMKGTTLVYNKTVGSGSCSATQCSTTPATILAGGAYKWRVRALTQGSWKPYSPYKTFTVDKPKAGFWPGDSAGFYVKPDRAHIYHFIVFVYVPACNGNTYMIDNPVAVSIVNRKFSFSGGYSANGTFTSSTRASGKWQLDYYYIAGCGLVISDPINWSATWYDNSQPGILELQPRLPGIPPGAAPAWLVEP